MNEVKEMVEELRNKKSRDSRDLLDRSLESGDIIKLKGAS